MHKGPTSRPPTGGLQGPGGALGPKGPRGPMGTQRHPRGVGLGALGAWREAEIVTRACGKAFCSCLRLCFDHIDFYLTVIRSLRRFSNWGIEIIMCVVFIRADQRDSSLLYCSLL